LKLFKRRPDPTSDSEPLTVLGHLKELRVRLVWIALAIAVTSTTAFFFADDLFELLKSPANPDPIAYAGTADNTTWNFTTGPFINAPALGPTPKIGWFARSAINKNAPTLESTIPADEAVNVGLNQNLVLNFSEGMAKGTGKILITRSADGAVVQTIPVTSPGVTVSGSTATIVHADLQRATDYHVTVDDGAFTNVPREIELVFIEVTEGFGTYMRVCIVAGLIASMPIIVYHLLMFVMPALTKRERRTVFLILPWITLMFAGGVYFGYRFLIPPALNFLLTFSADVADAQIRMGNYVNFVARLLLVIGVMFELPVITSFLSRMGIIDHKWLANKRRWFFLIAFVLAAVITPTPDPFNQSIVAGTLIALYEISIWLALLVQKRRPKSEFDQFMNDEGDYAPDADGDADGNADTDAEDDTDADVEPTPPPKHYDEQDG
jgi:sec-independent protein translocase protein TatC